MHHQFVVINGDGTTRLVCNYKHINEGTEDLAYPTPNVADILSQFNNKTLYSKIDIIKAFFNIKVKEESKKYTTIILPWGTYEWNVMPFGGKNAPATWAMASDRVFSNLLDVIKYVDDITVATTKNKHQSEDEVHIERLTDLFKRLVKFNLKIKIAKCDFFVQKIDFLGNTITPQGRKPSDQYIKKILSFRRPRNIKELRGYLGAIEWISSHIYGLKKLMVPLRPLLKHSRTIGTKITKWNSHTIKLDWKPEHQEAFEKIQNIIQKCELLHHPDFGKEFYLYTDASDKFYSGVLLQEAEDGKFVIIDMYSKMFSDTASKRHITSKEIMAIIESIKRWDTYLDGRKFTIHTDANNIVHLFKRVNKKSTNNAMHYRWALLLSPYQYDVKHVKGIDNKVADFLSRIDAESVINNENTAGKQNIEYFMNDDNNEQNKNIRNTIFYHLRHRKHSDLEDNYTKYEYRKSFIRSTKDKILDTNNKECLFTIANKLNKTSNNYISTLLSKLEHRDRLQNNIKIRNKYRHYTFPNIHEENPHYYVDPISGKRRSKRNKDKPRKNWKKIEDNEYKDIADTEKTEDLVINDDITLIEKENEFRTLSKLTDHIQSEIDKSEHKQESNIYDRDDDLLTINEEEKEKEEDIPEVASKIPLIDYKTRSSESIGISGRSLANESDDRMIGNLKMIIKQPIYTRDILKNKKTAKQQHFTTSHILHNQHCDPHLTIIRKVLEKKDDLNDIKDLPKKIRGDLKKKLYFIDSNDKLIKYKHPTGTKTVLPYKHKTAIIRLYHDGLLEGHSNKNAISQNLLNDGWYWCGYSTDIQNYIDSCEACVKARNINQRDGKMKLWKSTSFNECLCIDTVGPLPVTSSGNRYIINMVDRFTGYTVSVPTPSIGAFQITWTILNHWITQFGIPISILSDNGKEYSNQLTEDLSEILEINHKKIIAYISPTNGTVERYNRTMTTTLRKLMVQRNIRFDDNSDKSLRFISKIISELIIIVLVEGQQVQINWYLVKY